jgi:hypothetical protein
MDDLQRPPDTARWVRKGVVLFALAVLASGVLFLSAVYSWDAIAAGWYVWRFDHGSEAGRKAALHGLRDLGSSKLVPLLLRSMEETGIDDGIGKEAARMILDEGVKEWLYLSTLKEGGPSGSWSPERFLQGFRAIEPTWSGEFDRPGIRDFYEKIGYRYGRRIY